MNVLLPVVHPRMGSTLSAADSSPLLEPPGFLMRNYGRGTPIATLLAHIAYGAIVGGFASIAAWGKNWEARDANVSWASVITGSPVSRSWSRRTAMRRTARDRPRCRPACGADLLRALGADVDSESLRETPRRVADAYVELLTPQPFRATTFPNDDGYDGLIVARAIPFHSLCMHHMLPFHGIAHIGYLPAERIIGLSKLGRVVELFARDLQIQERLTMQIAGWLQARARAQGRRRRPGGRASVHVAARRAEARRQDRDLRAARRGPRRRPHPPGVPGPDHESFP